MKCIICDGRFAEEAKAALDTVISCDCGQRYRALPAYHYSIELNATQIETLRQKYEENRPLTEKEIAGIVVVITGAINPITGIVDEERNRSALNSFMRLYHQHKKLKGGL